METSIDPDAGLPSAAPSESLYSFIRRHLDAAGRLEPDGYDLPDEPRGDESEIRWAPGALDGVIGHHAGSADEAQQIRRIADLLVLACHQPTAEHLTELHDALAESNAMYVVDPLLSQLNELPLTVEGVRRVGLWLAQTSPKREPVKVGIALLGAAGLQHGIVAIRTLGAHEEFTLFAATALRNGLDDPDSELWALAASVDGWGRIHCVERLRATQDPQIRAWLLREGYRNSVMYEYTALIAAETGGLLAALQQDQVDRTVLTAAGDILTALTGLGPGDTIEDYADGADAVDRYLALMRTRAETPADYLAVAAIRNFLADEDRWETCPPGWDVNRRQALWQVCAEILAAPEWYQRCTAVLLNDDAEDGEVWAARAVAGELGIDTFDVTFRRLEQNPLSSDWFDAWRDADRSQANRLVELARSRLPIAAIASGPSDTLGLGPDYEAHSALDWTLQALRDHPGIGADLIIAGLQSPVTRNRNMAVQALQRWPVELWPPEARGHLEAAAASDPYEDLRDRARQLLRENP